MIGRVLAAPAAARTWREAAFLPAGLVAATPGFALVLLAAVAVPLSVLTIGLPLLVVVLFLSRAWCGVHRWLFRVLLGRTWVAPAPAGGTGLLGRARARLGDPAAWRSLAYSGIKLPLAAVSTYLAALLLAGGVVALTCPVWSRYSPTGWGLLDTGSWTSSWLVALPGLAGVLLFPWVVRGAVALDGLLASALLGAGGRDRRIGHLERGRADLAAEAAATLRRVERDLHDGAQAHLVAVGMTLSRIRERVDRLPPGDRPADLAEVAALTDAARATVASALTELRDVVRSIHPPALDAGLDTALQTLAARSPVPVDLRADTGRRASEPVETAAYFCVAELLANAARHADARRVGVAADDRDGVLTLRVTDDGRGGAVLRPGSGLAGLHRRVTALDGTLHLDSPAGGPTTVTVTLPTGREALP